MWRMPMATATIERMPMATSDCPFWAALDEARLWPPRSSRTKKRACGERERESVTGRERERGQWILSNDEVSDEESVLQHGVNIHVFVACNLES